MPGDLAAIEEWWPEAAATVRGTREPGSLEELQQTVKAGDALVIAHRDQTAPIGLLVLGQPAGGWLEFRFLALSEGNRGWGYGSEAVRQIEESGRAQQFAAAVYAGNGLGLYFWLRMGYRPATPGDSPWRPRGAGDIIAMIRELKE